MIEMINMGDLIRENNNFGYGVVTPAYVAASTTKKKRKGAGIKDDELIMMYNDLKQSFNGKFANSDLGELCGKWGLSNRQTPSRLKKLADQGLLSRFDTKPLTYEVK